MTSYKNLDACNNRRVCICSEEIKDCGGKSINIFKDKIYLILPNPCIEYYELYSDDKSFIVEIWGKIEDYFITIAEYREQRINEIING